MSLLVLHGTEVDPLEEVDPVRVRGRDRLRDRRLEALTEIEDVVRPLDRDDVGGLELEVVRLGAGGGEVPHRHRRAADLLGCIRDGVEGRDDAPLTGSSTRRDGDPHEHDPTDGNDSRFHDRAYIPRPGARRRGPVSAERRWMDGARIAAHVREAADDQSAHVQTPMRLSPAHAVTGR